MSKSTVQTLEDIARLANVSKSTVSRALNDSPLLNQATKERIQAIARKHHFQINIPARNLRLRQSHTIAFVTPMNYPEFLSADDFFGLSLLGSIGSGLHAMGYELLVIQVTPGDTTWVHHYLDSGRVDGFIIMGSNCNEDLIQILVAMDAPFIAWGSHLPQYQYCSVTGDSILGGELATRHLLQIGRQRIAFLGGVVGELTVEQRFEGYKNALNNAGISVDSSLIAYGNYSYDSGTSAMNQLLAQTSDLDAVFVNSDLMAIAAIKAIQQSGRQVPQDVAVVGFDDLPIAKYNNLSLTTIRQDIKMAGKLLAQNLIENIQSGVITTVTLPVELVKREST
ncbi:MAG: LacI family DNA-binding transcriptional regulator [Anaerolineaceae bacterium]|nr:LacI family DNA-binding transcriptional regulator [Anaerolineaceae bacterium]